MEVFSTIIVEGYSSLLTLNLSCSSSGFSVSIIDRLGSKSESRSTEVSGSRSDEN